MEVNNKYNVGDYVKTGSGRIFKIMEIRIEVTKVGNISAYYDTDYILTIEDNIKCKVDVKEIT